MEQRENDCFGTTCETKRLRNVNGVDYQMLVCDWSPDLLGTWGRGDSCMIGVGFGDPMLDLRECRQTLKLYARLDGELLSTVRYL